MAKERFKVAVAHCGHRKVLILHVGRVVVIKEGGLELATSFDAEVEKFRAIGCFIEYTHMSLEVTPIGHGRKLIELPTGHLVAA